jgi:hypothetical protein
MAKIKKEIIVYTNAYNMDVCMNKRELIPTMIEEQDLMSFEDWLSEEKGMEGVLEVLEKAMKKGESAAFVYSTLLSQYEEYADRLIEHLLDIGGRYQSSSIVVEVEI